MVAVVVEVEMEVVVAAEVGGIGRPCCNDGDGRGRANDLTAAEEKN